MHSTATWDLPVRLTHWLFVICLAVSWWTAEQRLMNLHRYSGYTLLGLLLFRIYWGFAGSSTARFSSFVKGPRAVMEYLRRTRAASASVIGHSPLAGWSVLAILCLLTLQVVLGLFVTDVDGLESGPLSHLVSFETGRQLSQWHETVFNVILAWCALHLAALTYYLVVQRNNLVSAMFTGRKRTAQASQPLRRAPAWRVWPGVALAGFIVWLIVRG